MIIRHLQVDSKRSLNFRDKPVILKADVEKKDLKELCVNSTLIESAPEENDARFVRQDAKEGRSRGELGE